jgi:hypothetical protein
VARQLSGAASVLEALPAWMPQGYRFGKGTGPEGWQVNCFAKAETGDGYA